MLPGSGITLAQLPVPTEMQMLPTSAVNGLNPMPLSARWKSGSVPSVKLLVPSARRCCSEAAPDEVSPSPRISADLACDAHGVRPSGCEHAVQDDRSDGRFSASARLAARSQSGANKRLVAAHRGLDQRTPTVAADLLLVQPTQCRHRMDMDVTA